MFAAFIIYLLAQPFDRAASAGGRAYECIIGRGRQVSQVKKS